MGKQNPVTEGVCCFFKNQDLQCKRRNIKMFLFCYPVLKPSTWLEATSQKNFILTGLRSQKNREGKEIEMSLLKTAVRIQRLAGLDTIIILTVKKNCQENVIFSVIWKFRLKLLQWTN